MPKTPDQRIDSLEKKVRVYGLCLILMTVLLFWTQRQRIFGWMDSAERWVSGVQNVKA